MKTVGFNSELTILNIIGSSQGWDSWCMLKSPRHPRHGETTGPEMMAGWSQNGFGGFFTNFNHEKIIHWLVVWNMNFIFPYIGNVIIPTDELIFFRGGRYTTNQIQDLWIFDKWLAVEGDFSIFFLVKIQFRQSENLHQSGKGWGFWTLQPTWWLAT